MPEALTIESWLNDRQHVTFKMAINEPMVKQAQSGIEYEPEVTTAMWRFLKPGDRAIDCGANLWVFTLLMARLVGDTGKVLAFEPDRRAYHDLVENITCNELKNVIPSDTLLWSGDGWIPFNITPPLGYSSVFPYANTEETIVLARALDSVVQPEWGHVRLIKIDCEGSEFSILEGARHLLERGVDCVIVECNLSLMRHMKVTDKQIREFMTKFGYE